MPIDRKPARATKKMDRRDEISDEEEARIQAEIAADPDNPEITDEQIAQLRPASEVLPPALYAALTRPRGRPKSPDKKEPIKLRIDRTTLDASRATGDGWHTRINDALATAASQLPESREVAPPPGQVRKRRKDKVA